MGQDNAGMENLQEVNNDKVLYFDDEKTPFSPLVLGFNSPHSINKFSFRPSDETIRKLFDEDDENNLLKGLPLSKIFQFCNPPELLNVLMTCKSFYNVGNSVKFWRKYYFNYFSVDDDISFISEVKNYKKEFFRRYSRYENAESIYKERFPVTKRFVPKNVDECRKYQTNFAIIGPKNVGKRAWLGRIFYGVNGKPVDHLILILGCPGDEKPNQNVKCQDDNNEKEEVLTSSSEEEEGEEEDDEDRILIRVIDGKNLDLGTNYKAFFLCFDLGMKSSWEKMIKSFRDIMKKSQLSKRMKDGSGRLNIMLIGLNSDIQRELRQVKQKKIMSFVRKNKLKGFVEICTKTGANCDLPISVMFEKCQMIGDSFTQNFTFVKT